MDETPAARRVAVTGVGVLTCLGRGLQAHRLGLEGAATGLGALTLFPAPQLAHSPVGQVPEEALTEADADAPRVERLGRVAARDALGGFVPAQPGVLVVGTTTGSVLESERAWAEARATPGGDPLRHMRQHPLGEVAFGLAAELGLEAECHTFVTACSSSSNAIGYGALRVRQGAPWALVGGIDTLCRMTYAGFHALRLLSHGAPRPFDAARSGVAVAEGAAFLLLEPMEAALARGAKIFGEVVGWGCTVDAFHQTAPDPKGVGMIGSMRAALSEAGLKPAQIAYVNAHGTGTEANDRVESLALRSLFDAAPPWVSSTKSLTGHTLGAAGAVEAALGLIALQTQRAPPTVGLVNPDAACELRHVPPGGAPLGGDFVLSNTFGFGGNNASLVLKRAPVGPQPSAASPAVRAARAYVHGLGVVAPGAVGCAAFLGRLAAPPRPDRVPEDLGDSADRKLSRLTRLERMAIAAAREALGSFPVEGTALIVGTAYARIAAASDFLEGLAQRGLEHGSPFAFYQSVYHALAGQLGIQLGMKGLGLTISARELSAESALRVGFDLLAAQKVERVLIVAADDVVPALADFLPPGHPVRAGWHGPSAAVADAGAAALLLSREPSNLTVEGCELHNHRAARDRLASPAQTRGPLERAFGAVAKGTLFSSSLGEPPPGDAEVLDDHLRLGPNPSAGLLRVVAALLRLRERPLAGRAVVQGLALGGGQAVTQLASVAPPNAAATW